MSTTVATRTVALPSLNVVLQNGEKVFFHSDTSIEADEIPVIDINGIFSDDFNERKAVADKVREAAHRIGFFYIVNHRVDPSYAERTFQQAKRFFALPEEQKMNVCTDLVEEYFGYFPLARYNRNDKKKKDLMEAYNWGYNPRFDPEVESDIEPETDIYNKLWPDDLPGFKETIYEHHTQLLGLARRLTKTFALALHLPEDYFNDYIVEPSAAMRLTHYPPQELGIGAHTDFECFTFVTQDENAGLEVLSKSGYWIKAKPITGSIVVNIADCFMRQTNDFFKSTVHRVVNKAEIERYSCPFFFGFNKDMKLEPVPTCVSNENPMKYPVVSSGEYQKWRAEQAKRAV